MPYVKCISGHTTLHIFRDLEKNGRALYRFANIDVPVKGFATGLRLTPFDWWREMDRTRSDSATHP
jgi:hypothetical protein